MLNCRSHGVSSVDHESTFINKHIRNKLLQSLIKYLCSPGTRSFGGGISKKTKEISSSGGSTKERSSGGGLRKERSFGGGISKKRSYGGGKKTARSSGVARGRR